MTMRGSRIGSLALCTFGLGGLAGAFTLSRGTSGPSVPAGDGEQRLARTLEALAADVDTMRRRVEQLEHRPEGAARLPDGDVPRAGAAGDEEGPARAAPVPDPKDPEAEKRAAPPPAGGRRAA